MFMPQPITRRLTGALLPYAKTLSCRRNSNHPSTSLTLSTHRSPSLDQSSGRDPFSDDRYQDSILIVNGYQRRVEHRSTHHKSISAKERTVGWLRILGFDLEAIERPKVIHVAGSKGKGTTCYYCNHILNEYQKLVGHPKRIGCYTSPHQVSIRERILINNKKISKELFSYYVRDLHKRIQSLKEDANSPPVPGYPGFLALLGIYIFLVEKVDVVVLETGIGGETDSTNVFPSPVATGITSIGWDHAKALGGSIESIARHKAGIFKTGAPAFTVEQSQEVFQVLIQHAASVGTKGGLQIVSDQNLNVVPNMHYQQLNASLALELSKAYFTQLQERSVNMDKLAQTLHTVHLPGRCEVIQYAQASWYMSTAHNVPSLQETITWFQKATSFNGVKRVLIYNQTQNKSSPRDPRTLLETIHHGIEPGNEFDCVIFCSATTDNTGHETNDVIDHRVDLLNESITMQQANQLIWRSLGNPCSIVARNIMEAIHHVNNHFPQASVLITGCNILVGRFLHIMRG